MWRKSACVVFCFLLSGRIYMGRDFGTAPVKSIESNVTTQKGDLGQLRDFKDLYVVFNKDNTVRTYSFSGR